MVIVDAETHPEDWGPANGPEVVEALRRYFREGR